MALSKQQSRARWRQFQDLAFAWDPIGVADSREWVANEYDCVVDPVLRMLERDATEAEITDFLMAELRDHFGLSPDTAREARFAATVKRWYQQHWSTASI